ncbi:putative bifunctional diguanylate cyclase/phosphodiesterase [Desulfocastanea catecholica]
MYRILIITGDAGDARTLGNALDTAGLFSIQLVRYLAEGIKRLEAGGVDAVMADLSLPDSQGMDTFDALHAVALHTPIMMLFSVEDEMLTTEALQRGARGYLSKAHFDSYLVPQSMRDMIQYKTIEENYFIEKTRASITLNSISDAVISTDIAGNVDYLNRAAETMTGWLREEARGHPIAEVMRIVSGATRQPERNPIELALQHNRPMTLTAGTILIRRDGRESAIADSAAPIHDWDGRIAGAVIVFHDVTAEEAMAVKMSHLAQHDFLTNLPNRILLNDRIEQAIIMAKRNGTHLALLFLDLDNFKNINDSLGHAIGDRLLQSVAKTLCACVRGSDTVSRQGGDEFVILLSTGKYGENAALTAMKVLTALTSPHSIAGHELNVTSSIGISIYPEDGPDAETLIKNADTAMYHAKGTGRNNYQFFTKAMNVRAVERQKIETYLRRAIMRREFVLHYQPKVALASGEITGSEALLRWNHPNSGEMLPDRFISIAEESGLIIPIGQWVLREACAQTKRWQVAGLKPVSVAINISVLELRYKGFVEGVQAVLQETGLSPSCLHLEITESVLMYDDESSSEILQRLKKLGVQLAVDDFGTGYSSLSYLIQFPIDVLKIDRSLVQDIGSTNGKGVVAGAVIAMGASLGKRVVAEGVENKEQLEFLKALNCEEGQGFLFSQPLTAEKFTRLLTTGIEYDQPNGY